MRANAGVILFFVLMVSTASGLEAGNPFRTPQEAVAVVSKWSVDEVVEWLIGIGVKSVCGKFTENEVGPCTPFRCVPCGVLLFLKF